jgi:hypothetical protein
VHRTTGKAARGKVSGGAQTAGVVRMTAQDFISKLAPAELERMGLIFELLSIRIPDAELVNGSHLRDASDFMAFLLELSAAAKLANVRGPMQFGPPYRSLRSQQERWQRENKSPTVRLVEETCPRCGHVHEGSAECGFDIGGGRICHCEMEVRV